MSLSNLAAPAGHTSVHSPQPSQRSSSTAYLPPPAGDMAPKRHILAHFPQPMQRFSSIFALSEPLKSVSRVSG